MGLSEYWREGGVLPTAYRRLSCILRGRPVDLLIGEVAYRAARLPGLQPASVLPPRTHQSRGAVMLPTGRALAEATMSRGARPYLSAEEQRTLASKAQQGDETAFGTLYEHFSEALTGYVTGRLRSFDDASDVASETFTTALTLVRDGRYDPAYTFYTFLKVIADSHIAHQLRKTHVEVPASPDGPGTPRYLQRLRPLADIPEIAFLPSQELELVAYELLLMVLSCGSKPHHAIAFCLIAILDWRPREVIEQLGTHSLFGLIRRVYEDHASLSAQRSRGRTLCRDHCPMFWQQLVSSVADVYHEPEYQHLRAHVGPVGDLSLSLFYGPKPAASLSDWCYKARTRARIAIETGRLLVDDGPYREHRRP